MSLIYLQSDLRPSVLQCNAKASSRETVTTSNTGWCLAGAEQKLEITVESADLPQ